MKILIFGISCIGKTSVGKLLAKKMNCRFIDLDDVNIQRYGSIEAFQSAFPNLYNRMMAQIETLHNLIDEDDEDMVIAVTPLAYADGLNEEILPLENVIAFELKDEPKHIFDRLLFTDENDVVLEDNEAYKMRYAAYYLKEIKEDLAYYGKVYEKVKYKIYLDGKSAQAGADMIYQCIRELKKSK